MNPVTLVGFFLLGFQLLHFASGLNPNGRTQAALIQDGACLPGTRETQAPYEGHDQITMANPKLSRA
ncbi:hypothetical protein SDC9_209684 [bioreactor metagenome]|uniref:Uncharacterized protein n=1 Tax=bioreactor metagenome TaxID=1076179 RepID=A0A645JDY8_9ZZZZ